MSLRLRYLILPLLLIGSNLAFSGEDWTRFPIGPYSGINNRDSSFAIPAQNAQDALNIEITPGGKSVKKRHGYGAAFTLNQTTSAVHGVYDFFDANGNEVSLFFSDTKVYGSVSGAAATVLLSTAPNGATWQCTDSLGQAYCVNSSRSGLYKISGSTLSQIMTVVSTGTMITTAVTRLAMAGFSDAPSRIDFSADGDFTTWGTGSAGSSAVQVTVNAPGARITHLTYAFGRLMDYKDTSFGYVLIGNQPLQTDWVVKTVAYDVGTNDNTSVYREGLLYFRGKDGHVYMFDGNTYQRLSREIAGTIGLSQTRASNSWIQSSQADWQAGTVSPTSFLETANVPGSVQLATTTPLSPFVDTTIANFAAGTLTNISTGTTSGTITLSTETNAHSILQSTKTTAGSIASVSFNITGSQAFYITNGFYLSSATFVMGRTGVESGTKFTIAVTRDSGASPGTVIVSTSIGTSTFTVISSSQAVFGASTTVQVNFPSTTYLQSGATYWFDTTYNDLGGSGVTWFVDNTISTMTKKVGSGTDYTPFIFTANGKRFNSSGNIVSQSFDNGFSTMSWLWNWDTFTANKTLPTNTTLTWETQSSADAVTWETLASVTSGSPPISSVQRYIRYKGTFGTTDVSTSPIVTDVTINMSSRTRPSGVLYSQVNNAPNITSWDSFVGNYNVSGGSVAFFVRSATGSFTQTSTFPALTSIVSGAVPSVTANPYFQIVSSFSVSNATNNATVTDFTLNWLEGNASDKAYATYFDDKIIWAVTSGTGATTNNKDLVFDMLNNTWIIWDLPANGFYVKANDLYFGGASSGYIFKYGDVENDNGSAINSYWKSKDFFGSDPFTGQELANISLVGKQVTNSTCTISYTINGSSTSSFYFPLTSSSKAFVGLNKNLPAGTLANSSFNIQFGNNAVDQSWEIYGIQVGIRNRTWIPGQ